MKVKVHIKGVFIRAGFANDRRLCLKKPIGSGCRNLPISVLWYPARQYHTVWSSSAGGEQVRGGGQCRLSGGDLFDERLESCGKG